MSIKYYRTRTLDYDYCQKDKYQQKDNEMQRYSSENDQVEDL